MSVTKSTTVGTLVQDFPQATRVLEKVGIDYCCGGERTLAEACTAAKLPVEMVVNFLEFAREEAGGKLEDRDWRSEKLASLIAHIVDVHHKYARDATRRVSPLFDKVVSVHGDHHPELAEIREIYRGMAEELAGHMEREETILFPCIREIEETSALGRASCSAEEVANPIRAMTHDHQWVGDALRSMRRASAGYLTPSDGCSSYRALYQALADLERDLHRHIHLENNILFPRAIELDKARRSVPIAGRK